MTSPDTTQDISENYRFLNHFFGAYLNQDYDIHGPELEDTLNAFVSSESLSWLTSTRDEIGRLVIEHSDDLESVMEVLSPDYSEPEMSAHDFLMLIDSFLAKSISARGASGQ